MCEEDPSFLKNLILEFLREETYVDKIKFVFDQSTFVWEKNGVLCIKTDPKLAHALKFWIKPICQPLDLLKLAKKLKIAGHNGLAVSVTPTVWWKYMQNAEYAGLIDVVERVSDLDIYKELLDWKHSGSILRMSDGLGLFNNGLTHMACGIRSSDWLKLDHNSYHLQEELDRYVGSLVRDREIREFSYRAFWPNGQIHEFTVNARLANYRDELVRIVKVVDCVPTTF